MVFEIEERRVEVADLRLGMYVCRLDRPWQETPFPLQGLELKDAEDIETLRQHCAFVFVDLLREVPPDDLSVLHRTRLSESRFERVAEYHDTVPVEEEAPRAREALDSATVVVGQILDGLAVGETLSAKDVDQAVRPVVESVLRSADALFWMESLRTHDQYSYSHAISCSALAAAFGRHMGFAEDTIISLSAGAMLMDIGKAKLPEELLQHPGPLDQDQWKLAKSHVIKGLAILEQSDIRDADVHDVVRTHHERFDGSGYPGRLMDNVIPMVGRMAAIVDAFDAMTTPRPYRAAVDKHQALRSLYAARDTLFHAELIEQFQSCLGVYPTGSLVELNSGEVAVVMAQNHVRRLRPRVAILTDVDKQLMDDFRIVDLMHQAEGSGQMEIRRSIKPGSLDFDPAELFLS